ncbi:hypothetical protein V8G54_034685 [Vigna mungo]|uniref:Uncharacterized protein n=1 Tax=Vigna mungo TaxID=3915 RepID=A0AAQ3RC10_VIGMU
MVLIDRLSKFGHFIPLKVDYNTKIVAKAFINHVATVHARDTTLAMSLAYHPQSDDQIKVLKKYWRCICGAMFFIAQSFGRETPMVIPYEVNAKDSPNIQDSLINMAKLLHQLKHNLMRVQNYMKLQAYTKRRELQLQIGDLALVKLQP